MLSISIFLIQGVLRGVKSRGRRVLPILIIYVMKSLLNYILFCTLPTFKRDQSQCQRPPFLPRAVNMQKRFSKIIDVLLRLFIIKYNVKSN